MILSCSMAAGIAFLGVMAAIPLAISLAVFVVRRVQRRPPAPEDVEAAARREGWVKPGPAVPTHNY